MLPSNIKLYIRIGLALVAALIGWQARGVLAQAEVAKLKATHITQLADIQAVADKAAKANRETEAAWRARLADIDRKRIQEASRAQQEIDDLRAAVAAGARRLHVKATCGGGNAVPGNPGAAGVGDGAAPVLTADSEQAYFSLRANLAAGERKLAACQDVLSILLEQSHEEGQEEGR